MLASRHNGMGAHGGRGMVLEGGVAGAQPLHKGGRLRPTAHQHKRDSYILGESPWRRLLSVQCTGATASELLEFGVNGKWPEMLCMAG